MIQLEDGVNGEIIMVPDRELTEFHIVLARRETKLFFYHLCGAMNGVSFPSA